MSSHPDPLVVPSASGYLLLQRDGELLPPDAGHVLLPLARAAIATELGVARPAREDLSWLKRHAACFITVTQGRKLRGCIGTLRPHRPLGEDVRANAVAAAFRDPRFKPLSVEEFDGVSLEISVLSALEPLSFSDEQDALRQLRVGIDGIVFEYGHHSSTFLPQVWETMKDSIEFLAHLKYKAGLPPDFWDREVKLERYTATKWRETDEG
jgi:AmmeMemoRadiSam system protein A